MPVFGGELPIGAGLMWYSATAPASFLICDGTSLSRATYAKLFAVIGTTYGAADANSFSLPDLRQRFPLGKAASGTGNALAGTGGAIDHAHTSAAHTHTVPAHYHDMGTGSTAAIDISHTHGTSSVTGTIDGGGHTHSLQVRTFTGNTTNGTRIGNTNLSTNQNDNTTAATQTDAGTHTHTHSLTAAGQTLGTTSKSLTGKVGLVTGGVDGNASMTSGSTTPSDTGTNNPPYLVVNYIIKFQ